MENEKDNIISSDGFAWRADAIKATERESSNNIKTYSNIYQSSELKSTFGSGHLNADYEEAEDEEVVDLNTDKKKGF